MNNVYRSLKSQDNKRDTFYGVGGRIVAMKNV